jgi:hypothetical protein
MGKVSTSVVMRGEKMEKKRKGKRAEGKARRIHRQHFGYQTNTETILRDLHQNLS